MANPNSILSNSISISTSQLVFPPLHSHPSSKINIKRASSIDSIQKKDSIIFKENYPTTSKFSKNIPIKNIRKIKPVENQISYNLENISLIEPKTNRTSHIDLKKQSCSLHEKIDISNNGDSMQKPNSNKIKKRLIDGLNFENWKKKEKIKIKNDQKTLSIFSSDRKIANSETSLNLTKFYLEFNQSYHPLRKKLISKQELSTLIGFETLNLDSSDSRVQSIIENYPKYYFLDYNELKINDIKNIKPDQSNLHRLPNERKMMTELAYWLDEITCKIVDESHDGIENQVFSLQKAFKICIEHIASQISRECNERGVMLIHLWDLMVDMCNLSFKKIHKDRENMEIKFKKEIVDIKNLYKDTINKLRLDNQETCEQIEKIKKDNQILIEERDFFRSKELISEKIRKRAEMSLNELKIQFENIFLENLKFKLLKEEKSNRREILKKAYEEINKKRKNNNNTLTPGNDYKIEGIYKKMTSGELPKTDLKKTTDYFIKEMTNLSFSIFDNNIDYNETEESDLFNEVREYMVREAATDTLDLTNLIDNSTSTETLYKFTMRDESAQTLLIDEIDDNIDENKLAESIMLDSEHLFEKKIRRSITAPEKEVKVGRFNLSPPKVLRQRQFSFNLETQANLDKLKELQSFTLSKICDFYGEEMIKFYDGIFEIIEIFLEKSQNPEMLNLFDKVKVNKTLHLQFLDTIYSRDSKRMKEILGQKIDLIQQKIDLNEIQKNFDNNKIIIHDLTKKYQDFVLTLMQTSKTDKPNEDIKQNTMTKISSQRKQSLKPILEERDFKKTKKQKKKRKFSAELLNNSASSLNQTDTLFNTKIILKENNKNDSLDTINANQDLIADAFKLLSNKKILSKVSSGHYWNSNSLLLRIQILYEKDKKEMKMKNLGGMSLQSILKNIIPFYFEMIRKFNNFKENETNNLNPLFFIFYEYLFNRHGGNREISETKIIKLIESGIYFEENHRVKNFLRLMGFLEEESISLKNLIIDGSDLVFYLSNLQKLDDMVISSASIPGINLFISIKECSYVGLSHAIDTFTFFAKSKLSEETYKIRIEDCINKIKAIKIPDPLISRKYVVDIDFVIEKLFWVRNELFHKYFSIFKAVDIDNDDAINIDEFILLLRNVEKNKLDYKAIIKIFKQETDLSDADKKKEFISLKRFASLCEKNNLMSEKTIQNFEFNVNDDILNYEGLRKDWDVKKNLIKLKFIKTNTYNPFYSNLIKEIDKFINIYHLDKAKEKEIWLQYRLLEEESKTLLLEFEIEMCLPRELAILSSNKI